MTRTRRSRLVALLLAFTMILAACGGDDGDEEADGEDVTDTTAAGEDEGEDTGDGEAEGFAVDTADCPDEATEPIEGTIKIGSTMPLSGGAAAAAFAPVAAGLTAFVDYANAEEL